MDEGSGAAKRIAWALMGGSDWFASVDQLRDADGPREVRSSHSRMFERDENYLLVHYGAWSRVGRVKFMCGERFGATDILSWMGIRSGFNNGIYGLFYCGGENRG